MPRRGRRGRQEANEIGRVAPLAARPEVAILCVRAHRSQARTMRLASVAVNLASFLRDRMRTAAATS
jgi:hypothetical protein